MIINLCNDFKCDVTSFVISTSAPSSFSIPLSVFLFLPLSLFMLLFSAYSIKSLRVFNLSYFTRLLLIHYRVWVSFNKIKLSEYYNSQQAKTITEGGGGVGGGGGGHVRAIKRTVASLTISKEGNNNNNNNNNRLFSQNRRLYARWGAGEHFLRLEWSLSFTVSQSSSS